MPKAVIFFDCKECGTGFEQEVEKNFESVTRSCEFLRDILLEDCPHHGGQDVTPEEADDGLS